MGPPRESDVVAVPAIIGSLKCAFAEALKKESGEGQIERLKGRVAAGTLTLKVVDDTKISASIKGKAASNGPFVFSYMGGTGSILPSLGGSVQRTDTVKTTISFRYLMDAKDTSACNLIPQATRAKYGFSNWLAKTISGLDFNAKTEPVGQIDKLEYSADFAVISAGNGGLDFDVVFLGGSAGVDSTRNDLQSLAFSIAPPDKEKNPVPGGANVGAASQEFHR
jgi:hypothetical protein